VERLLKKYPTAIAGMKDSSGDWNNTRTFLDAFARSGFDIFPGSESFLLAGLRNGGAGCISATANVNPAAIDKLYREWKNADADAQQEALNAVRKATGQYVMIPALKQVVAHYANDLAWTTVRPPLTELTAVQAKNVLDSLKKLGFEMQGLVKAHAKAA
jgi:4-hydroxy-tetrahydrodipicolinate synthase